MDFRGVDDLVRFYRDEATRFRATGRHDLALRFAGVARRLGWLKSQSWRAPANENLRAPAPECMVPARKQIDAE